MPDGDLRAAVAAGVIGAEDAHRALLRSIVDVARAIFSAKASSIFLLDEDTDELVFEAVSGEGEEHLVGLRIPSGTGIAGWVVSTRQPLVIDDLQNDPRHARAVAERTGYVPNSLMAVPLLNEERSLGVLQVLDRHKSRFTLQQMDLLGLFANQAAIALDLLQRARRAKRAVEQTNGDVGAVARVAEALDALPEERKDAGLRLLAALEEVLGPELQT
jgi:GAF domain-containing protein